MASPFGGFAHGFLPLWGVNALPLGGGYLISCRMLYYCVPVSLPYLLLGMLVARNEGRLGGYRYLGLSLVVVLLLSYVENYVFSCAGFLTWEFLTTPLLAILVLVLALRHKSFGAGSKAEYLGRVYSARIYYYHALTLSVLMYLSKCLPFGWGYHRRGFVYAFVLTCCFCALLAWVERKLGRRLLP